MDIEFAADTQLLKDCMIIPNFLNNITLAYNELERPNTTSSSRTRPIEG